MKNKILAGVAVFFFLANIFVWSFVYAHSYRSLKVSFLDIGQGDSILIQAPNGNTMLIDGGPDKKVVTEIGKELPFAKKDIDVVLATHPDADHIGGLPYVFKEYNVGTYVDDGVVADTSAFNAIADAVKSEPSIKYIHGVKDTKIILDVENNISFTILSPYAIHTSIDTNAASVVGQLVYGSSTFLFTGDAPISIEKYLVENDKDFLKSDVLKVGHHGSKTSSSEEFVEAVSPQYAIISAGKNNSYGHPHKEVLNILNSLGITTLRTDEDGTVECESNSLKVVCK